MEEKNMKKKAKSEMLSMLSDEMKEMMREGYADSDLGKKMKVTVASDSEEGLQKGLSKAKEIMKKKLEMGEMDEEDCEMEDDYSKKKKLQDKE